MYSKISSKALFLIFYVIAALMLFSCSGGSSSGSDAGADTLDMSFTSRAGFNVDGNVYHSLLLSGTESSGDAVLTNGSGTLTGTYSRSSSRAVVNGYYCYVHWADGVIRDDNYICKVTVIDGTVTMDITINNTRSLYMGTTEEVSVDPFEGTEWAYTFAGNTAVMLTFHNGNVGGGIVESILNEYHAGNNSPLITDCWYDESTKYTVTVNSAGEYKAVFLKCKKDNDHIEVNEWHTAVIKGNELIYGKEIHSVSKVDSYKSDQDIPACVMSKSN